jgi:hypothetical protein
VGDGGEDGLGVGKSQVLMVEIRDIVDVQEC